MVILLMSGVSKAYKNVINNVRVKNLTSNIELELTESDTSLTQPVYASI